MAKCHWCEQEMTDPNTNSCVGNNEVEFPDGTVLPAIPADQDCHDCNAKSGGFHHPGCDMEQCPKCNGQLISCGCLDCAKKE